MQKSNLKTSKAEININVTKFNVIEEEGIFEKLGFGIPSRRNKKMEKFLLITELFIYDCRAN